MSADNGPAISVITSTMGRPTLKTVADEIVPQLGENDEWLLVGDGPQPVVQNMVINLPINKVRYCQTEPDHCWGNPQKEYGILAARGTHIWFIDDDDRVAPWAMDTIRRRAIEHPCRPLIFKTIYMGYPIWRENQPKLYVGNVSTQCFVIPNVKGKIGLYGRAYAGDFDYITSTVALYGEKENAIVWCPEILSVIGVANAPLPYKRHVERWVWKRP